MPNEIIEVVTFKLKTGIVVEEFSPISESPPKDNAVLRNVSLANDGPTLEPIPRRVTDWP